VVTRAIAAVTISANCVRAPAWTLTAVCVVPPPAGIAPTNAPPILPSPVASSSLFARGADSSFRAQALPAASVSVKLIKAIPSAPGHSMVTKERSGLTSEGSPRGMWPTSSIPRPCRFSKHELAIAAPAAISGAGTFGMKRSMLIRNTIVATPMASVANDVLGML
jgi:hypothetical protein